MSKDAKQITTFGRERLCDHRQAKGGSNWDVPFGAEVSLFEEACVSQNQNNTNIYKLLIKDEFENGPVLSGGAGLFFVLSRQNKYLLCHEIYTNDY